MVNIVYSRYRESRGTRQLHFVLEYAYCLMQLSNLKQYPKTNDEIMGRIPPKNDITLLEGSVSL